MDVTAGSALHHSLPAPPWEQLLDVPIEKKTDEAGALLTGRVMMKFA